MATSFADRVEALHAAGLDPRYDDVLLFEDTARSRPVFEHAGPAYDYQGQRWLDHPDHAHIVSTDPSAPPLFCGSDRTTCVGLPARREDVAELTRQVNHLTVAVRALVERSVPVLAHCLDEYTEHLLRDEDTYDRAARAAGVEELHEALEALAELVTEARYPL
jgi:hypothetical protein